MARFPIENGYLFVHIPKTAGTSFRDSLDDFFGDGLYCDYGPDSATSPIVADYIHQRHAFPEFGEFLANHKQPVCLSGHYPLKKYGALFYIKNVMVFLRNPVQRTISHYEHMRRVDGITESLESFCSNPANMNVQLRNLGRASFNLIGFLGLQEYYRESLQLLHAQNGLQIKESFLNINKQRSASKYKLDDEMMHFIRKHNDKDLALYKSAKKVFLQRYELFSAGKNYIHGMITESNSYRVAGWAINQHSDLPVKLLIYVDGVEVQKVTAHHYCHELREWNTGRQAYVGFELEFKSPLAPESVVECVVIENDQQLLKPLF